MTALKDVLRPVLRPVVYPVNNDSAFSWQSYWMKRFDFFYIGGLSGNNLDDITSNNFDITITGKDFSGDYIPYTSAATFQAPDNATLKTDDTDYLWFDRNGVVRNVEVSELVGYDFARTIVKYDNSAPYHIRFIGILKSGETLSEAELTKLYSDFELSQFWSGALDGRGVIKGNRAGAQSVWPVISQAALNYSDTYKTAVEADGGVIISMKMVQSEYQRLINTGNILSCWYAYHYQCGVKKAVVDYGGGVTGDMVSKWYNMSPVAGRFAASVAPYSVAPGTDARPEYTALGLRFRTTNLDGGVRCGLENAATVLTNNTGKLRFNATVTSLGASPIAGKGFSAGTNGIIMIQDVVTTRKISLTYSVADTAYAQLSTAAFFTDGVETRIGLYIIYGANDSVAIYKDDNLVETLAATFGPNSQYPQVSYGDMIGCIRVSGRSMFNGYIKQIELFTL
jgi:hypothetical protein